jgi:hypothetical protein
MTTDTAPSKPLLVHPCLRSWKCIHSLLRWAFLLSFALVFSQLVLVRGSLSDPAAVAEHVSSFKRVVVLYSQADPLEFHAPCPEATCDYVEVSRFQCPENQGPVEALIISGHSVPPVYLGTTPEVLASAVRCFAPKLIVLDTCYGFSSPLLDALVSLHMPLWVVGATFKLPPSGLFYDDTFYANASIQERRHRVRTRSGAALEEWWIEPKQLSKHCKR